MTGNKVLITFSGPNGSGKTLMMNIVTRQLADCGCLVTSFEDEHMMEVKVLEWDTLGKASREAKSEGGKI